MTLTKTMGFALVLVSVATGIMACKKDHHQRPPLSKRTVQFELFTSHDFSKETDSIWFSVFIAREGNKPVWDSALAPMTLKDIPQLQQKLVANKTILGDNALLRAGFRYEIKNVGHTSIIDTLNAGTNFKIISVDFQ